MTRRAVVSGGTGFVGGFIVERLIAAGYRVVVLARAASRQGMSGEALHHTPFDLEPETVGPELFQNAQLFVHAAFHHLPGRYRGGEGDDAEGFRRRNLEGTKALFDTAKAAGVERIIFLSSRAAYGARAPGVMLHEDMPSRPDTLYGEVKLAAEHYLERLCRDGLRAASLRITGVYGSPPAGRAHKWGRIIDQWRNGMEVPSRVATEVHGRDVAAATMSALAALETDAAYRLFNVSDITVDHADIVDILNRASGWAVPPPPRADAGVINEMDTNRLRALGWEPGGWPLLETTLKEILSGSPS